jgi:hypothetical protein
VVGEYQKQGPVHFFLYGAKPAVESGEPLVSPEVIEAVDTLEEHL